MTWLDSGSESGDTYLPDVVRLLWPEPARLTTGRRSPGDAQRRYLVVPSARRPKVLIPAASRRVSAAAIRGFKSTQSARERIVLAALATGLRLGAGAALPDRLVVSDPPGTPPCDLESYLAHNLGRPVHLSLHVSAPRAVRKPVLQVIDDTGRTIAFAKLGVDEFTSRLVRSETNTVRRLATVAWRSLSVPRVLHAAAWSGHELLVQAAFGRAGGYERAGRALGAAMDELARAEGTTTGALTGSRYWQRLSERVSALAPSEHREVLRSSLAELARPQGEPVLEFGAWHGDWTPWNMNVAGDRVQVWDWEKFDTDVPVGFDAAHFHVQRAIVEQRRAPADAFAELLDRAAAVLAPHRLDELRARRTAWLYAVHIATTYLEDGELEAGDTPATRLASWLARTLQLAAATC